MSTLLALAALVYGTVWALGSQSEANRPTWGKIFFTLTAATSVMMVWNFQAALEEIDSAGRSVKAMVVKHLAILVVLHGVQIICFLIFVLGQKHSEWITYSIIAPGIAILTEALLILRWLG